MRRAFVNVAFAVSLMARACNGQTNLNVPPLHLFSIIPAYTVHRPYETAPVKSIAPFSASVAASTDPNSIAASIEKYEKWYGNSWLQPPRRQTDQGGFYHWAASKIFPEPETVRVKNIGIGGGVVTAIKKRNPLGLINQNVFTISY